MKETFLIADIDIEIILEMLFFSLDNADVQLAKVKRITSRNNTTATEVSTFKRIELFEKREYAIAALDKKSKTFIKNKAALLAMSINPNGEAQIRALIGKNAHIEVPAEYLDYANIFSSDFTIRLLEHSRIYNYTINFAEKKITPWPNV